MGIVVYSLLWVMQDFVHQPYGDYMKVTTVRGTARTAYSKDYCND